LSQGLCSVGPMEITSIDRARSRTDAFVCTECGRSAQKWFGRCPDCGGWSTAASPSGALDEGCVTSLSTLEEGLQRWPTGVAEVDRVLGGGLVPGSVVLLAGEPGIGKSTLVLQLLDGVLASGRSSLLVTGEESSGQVALRARRLGVARERFRIAPTTSLDAARAGAETESAEVLVVDSIQTLENSDLDHAPGSVVQVRECAAALVRFAKSTGTAVVIVGHVTKEGTVAGPKTLEHIVDAVLALEGERTGTLRLLRSTKNRFGSCDETGVFTMGEKGLDAVGDPSAMLLADRQPGVSGSVVFPSLEGTRPMLVEVQALLNESDLPHPRRVAIGLDARRLALLLGVLAKRAEIKVAKLDIFVAAAGGIIVREPASDLALAIALYSAAREVSVCDSLVAIGEVGLGGELRRVPGMERRLAESARLGFTQAIVPRGTKDAPKGIELLQASDLREALRLALAPTSEPACRLS
jgi:DNA repair protein RadA/Sms